jgi:hypothetical protein
MRLAISLMGVPVALAVFLSGCDRSYSKEAVQSVISPDGRVETVVYEINGGATTSFGYEVDLRTVGDSKSTNVAELYGALRNAGAYGVNVKWSHPSCLHIEYLRAKSVVSSRASATVGGQQVSVFLDAGVNDPSAPGGGMLQKLPRR